MAHIVITLMMGTAMYKGAQAIWSDTSYEFQNATPGKNSCTGWCWLILRRADEIFIGPVPTKIRPLPTRPHRQGIPVKSFPAAAK
jgi:hypothetical protein